MVREEVSRDPPMEPLIARAYTMSTMISFYPSYYSWLS
jgi:hypothetical protein